MSKAGFRYRPDSVKDAFQVWDALNDFISMFRSMDQETAVKLRKMMEGKPLSNHGPVGLELGKILIAFSP